MGLWASCLKSWINWGPPQRMVVFLISTTCPLSVELKARAAFSLVEMWKGRRELLAVTTNMKDSWRYMKIIKQPWLKDVERKDCERKKVSWVSICIRKIRKIECVSYIPTTVSDAVETYQDLKSLRFPKFSWIVTTDKNPKMKPWQECQRGPIEVFKEMDRSRLSAEPLGQSWQTYGIGKKTILCISGVQSVSSLINLETHPVQILYSTNCPHFLIYMLHPQVRFNPFRSPSRVPQLFAQVHWWQRDPDLRQTWAI